VTLGDHIEFIDGAREMLLLQKGKYVLVAVTNGTKIAQKKKLSASGLDKIFDAIFISEEVGAEKPDTVYFDHVFDKMNISDKREVIIIGDSLTSDIKGGVLSGIHTCWFNPKHLLNALNLPITYEIDSIYDIQKVLGNPG
jgi:2-haloacid dehalogenase